MTTRIVPATAALLAIVAFTTSTALYRMNRPKERIRVSMSGIFATAAIAWPVLIGTMLRVMGVSIRGNHVIWFGITWPLVLLVWELVDTRTHHRDPETREVARVETIKNNSTALVSAAWPLGALLPVLNSNGTGHTLSSARLIMACVLACVAFIVPPVPGSRRSRSVTGMSVTAFRKAVFHYASGFFIVGLGVALAD